MIFPWKMVDLSIVFVIWIQGTGDSSSLKHGKPPHVQWHKHRQPSWNNIYIHLYPSIYIYIHLYPSISIYIHLHLYPSISIYIHLYPSISIYIHLYPSPSISIYIHLYIYISIYIHLYPSISIYIHLYPSPSISIYIHLYPSMSLSSIIHKNLHPSTPAAPGWCSSAPAPATSAPPGVSAASFCPCRWGQGGRSLTRGHRRWWSWGVEALYMAKMGSWAIKMGVHVDLYNYQEFVVLPAKKWDWTCEKWFLWFNQ